MSTSTVLGSNLGVSVVPSLMQVYESITQSSPERTEDVSPSKRINPILTEFPTVANTNVIMSSPNEYQRQLQVNYQIQQQPIQSTVLPSNVASETARLTRQTTPSTDNSNPARSTPEARTSNRKRSGDSDKSVNSCDESKAGVRKKCDQSDSRWSKRFAWPDELHRDFVAAVFDVGLKHSSPSAIIEEMPKNELITTERIKSHLQKYRLHRQKSKRDFMASYDSTMNKYKAGNFDLDPKSLSSAEVAAHLTYSSMKEGDEPAGSAQQEVPLQGGVIQLPILTEEEKKSPVGASIGYLLGLFFSLKQQLELLRAVEKGGIPVNVSASSSYPSIYSTQNTISGDGQQSEMEDGRNSIPSTDHVLFPTVNNHERINTRPMYNTNPIEESDHMKREMQNHIHIQNNLRKMKEQEYSKCMTSTGNMPYSHVFDRDGYEGGHDRDMEYFLSRVAFQQDGRHFGDDSIILTKGQVKDSLLALSDDAWQSSVVDDELLFEFLKEN